MKLSRAEEIASAVPFDFGWTHALITIYSLQQYEKTCERGTKYRESIFYNSIFGVLTGLKNYTSRKTILGHLDNPQCVVCHEPVSLKGRVLDHIIPQYLGGEHNLENTMVLCKSHNSSKGKKDLIEWWVFKEWKASDLPRDILCLYARLMWKNIDRISADSHRLPDYVKSFISDRASTLPSKSHIVALYGSAYAATSFLGWERTHGDL